MKNQQQNNQNNQAPEGAWWRINLSLLTLWDISEGFLFYGQNMKTCKKFKEQTSLTEEQLTTVEKIVCPIIFKKFREEFCKEEKRRIRRVKSIVKCCPVV